MTGLHWDLFRCAADVPAAILRLPGFEPCSERFSINQQLTRGTVRRQGAQVVRIVSVAQILAFRRERDQRVTAYANDLRRDVRGPQDGAKKSRRSLASRDTMHYAWFVASRKWSARQDPFNGRKATVLPLVLHVSSGRGSFEMNQILPGPFKDRDDRPEPVLTDPPFDKGGDVIRCGQENHPRLPRIDGIAIGDLLEELTAIEKQG